MISFARAMTCLRNSRQSRGMTEHELLVVLAKGEDYCIEFNEQLPLNVVLICIDADREPTPEFKHNFKS